MAIPLMASMTSCGAMPVSSSACRAICSMWSMGPGGKASASISTRGVTRATPTRIGVRSNSSCSEASAGSGPSPSPRR